MAAGKRRFDVPNVETLDGDHATSKSCSSKLKLFKKSTDISKSGNDGQETDYEARKRLVKALRATNNYTSSSSSSTRSENREVDTSCYPNDSSSKETTTSSSAPANEGSTHLSRVTGTGSGTMTTGKSFKDTFAFLKKTRHYEEADAKMKEIE